MKKTITTQEELDKIEIDFVGEIIIVGGDLNTPIELTKYYPNAYIILSGNAIINMRGSSQVKEMRGSSQVNAMWGSSQVKEMRGSSQVNVMWGSSQVNEMRESSQVKEMRKSSQVNVMWGSSQVNVMRGSSQVNVMWGSSQVNEMRESSQVNVMRGSSQVNVMWGSSQVNEMWGSSQVNVMWESSQVKEMRGSSQVKEMRGSSQVNAMWGSSQVKEMRGSSQVNEMRESSQVKEMWGSSIISRVKSSDNKIFCYGYNYVFLEDSLNPDNIKLNETSQIITIKTFNTEHNIDFYLKNYPIVCNGDNLIMYKAVRKNSQGIYFADYDNNFIYELGKIKTEKLSSDINDSCKSGIHVSHLQFAVKFGKNWDNLAILEVEVNKNKVVVAKDCDGKIRTSKVKVIRELEKSEYEKYL